MITIKQLSIFLENKNGRINDVAKVLAKEGINMQAFSMAETADFGILRLIVSDVEKAVNALRTSDFAVMLTDVVCIQCPNTPGSLSAVSRLPRCRKYLYRIHVCILRRRYGTNNHSSHRSEKMYRNITEEPL